MRSETNGSDAAEDPETYLSGRAVDVVVRPNIAAMCNRPHRLPGTVIEARLKPVRLKDLCESCAEFCCVLCRSDGSYIYRSRIIIHKGKSSQQRSISTTATPCSIFCTHAGIQGNTTSFLQNYHSLKAPRQSSTPPIHL